MCLKCDGYSDEQIHRMTDLHIRVHGWSVVTVEATLPWCYTIGLQESYGHPELVACGMEMAAERRLIQTVTEMITNGGVDDAGLDAAGIRLVTVHSGHLRGGDWFGGWQRYYGRVPAPGTFLQIVPPPSWFCSCHRHAMPRLDRPEPTRRTASGHRH